MKKWLATLLSLMLIVSCFAAHAEATDDSLQKILDKGSFTMGLDDSFPPMGFRDDEGNIVGFDVDVAKAVCEILGVELALQPIDWSAKEMELNGGSIDCIWNGFTMTEARMEALSFSVPYLANEQVLVVKADSDYQTLADLAGKTLGLQAGSSAADALEGAAEFKATLSNVAEFEDNVVALMDLDNGGVDVVLMDIIVANYNIAQKGGNYRVLEEALAPEMFGIGFRKADVALTDAINDALGQMVENGKLAEIATVWFGEDITCVAEELAKLAE